MYVYLFMTLLCITALKKAANVSIVSHDTQDKQN